MIISRVKQCRFARDMSIKELCKRSGVSEYTICKLERQTEIPTIRFETMKRVANALEFGVNVVFPMKT